MRAFLQIRAPFQRGGDFIRGAAALIAAICVAASPSRAEEEALGALSLEELLNVDVATGTLTGSTLRDVPATVTRISSEDIRASGARSMNDLLERFVPNTPYLRHVFNQPHVGVRGIIRDRDEKYLLLVYGRIRNEKNHYGAFTERDLVTLGNIDYIDVIRGPGSAIYGPGEIAAVVNVDEAPVTVRP